MDQKENKEEQFQAVIDGTENIKPKKKKEEKKGLKYELLDLVKTFVICFVCIFLLTNFVVKPVRVDGRSMDPTLEDGEIGLMNVFIGSGITLLVDTSSLVISSFNALIINGSAFNFKVTLSNIFILLIIPYFCVAFPRIRSFEETSK